MCYKSFKNKRRCERQGTMVKYLGRKMKQRVAVEGTLLLIVVNKDLEGVLQSYPIKPEISQHKLSTKEPNAIYTKQW